MASPKLSVTLNFFFFLTAFRIEGTSVSHNCRTVSKGVKCSQNFRSKKKKNTSTLRGRGFLGQINLIWLVQDTYPNAAIWLVRATYQSIPLRKVIFFIKNNSKIVTSNFTFSSRGMFDFQFSRVRLHEQTNMSLFWNNCLTPISDQDRISPYDINTISSRQVRRIKKSIS